jgi:predicted MPP superfamily phosphohydrolase
MIGNREGFRLKQIVIFISIMTTLIGLAYSYMGYRIVKGLGIAGGYEWILWGIIAFLILSIPVSFFFTHSPYHPRLQSIISYSSFLSLGFLTILLSLILLQDVLISIFSIFISLLLKPEIAELLYQNVHHFLQGWSGKFTMTVLILTISSILTAWGMFQAHLRIRIVNVYVPIKNLHPDLIGFTIAQISDVHIGPTIQRPFLQHVVKRIQNIKPDLVAITGDLVDGSSKLFAHHLLPLSDLKSTYGTFFVTGNHEYYNGAISWLNEIRKLGIHVLLNENKLLHHKNAILALAGVTDLKAGSIIREHKTNPRKAFIGAEKADIKILLAHQPNSIMEAGDLGFDLQLSGHTHGGQYFPGNLIIYLAQKFVAGLHKYKNTLIYISRGTGYWGPPLRIGSPSEITKLVLVDSNSAEGKIQKVQMKK